MAGLDAALIVQILGLGTSAEDEFGFVEVILSDGSKRAIAFDEALGNPVALAFLTASSHLEAKRAARRHPEDTEIVSQPVRVQSANAYLAQRGPERVMILELNTPQGAVLRFELPVRAGEVLAKRLQKKGMPQKSQASKAGRPARQ